MSINKEKYRLWQHPNGTIYVVWTERAAGGGTGMQTKRVSTGSTNWELAEQYRAQFIAGIENPAPPTEPNIGYLLKRYCDEHGPRTRCHETIKFHLKALNPFFGNLLPKHVSNKLLLEYANSCTHLKPGSILRQLRTLKAALHYAEGNRWIEPLPKFIMPLPAPPPRDIWLTREQVALLIEKAKSPHLKLFTILAVSTAARSGAILGLTWQQVDMEKRIIDFGRGFGNKRRAIVPINDILYEELKTAKELAQSDYVVEYHGKKVACVRISFTRLCRENGIKASPHALRHTAATWLVMDGVPLSEVARLLGNSEAMVEQVYGKHSPDYLRRAVGVLNLKKLDTLQP